MSVRERRNRKDARGKTPEQIQRGYHRHELAYAEITEGQRDLPLNPAGYLQGIRTMFDHWEFHVKPDGETEKYDMPKVFKERDWLIQLLVNTGRVDITDTGFDFRADQGEIVYEVPDGRFEISIREL